MPGGGGDYLEFGRKIFKKIKEFNDQGIYYPLWGTCLGFEMLTVYTSEADTAILESYPLDHGSLALKFTTDPRETQMYGWLEDLAFYFEKYNMTYNSHNFGMDPDKFETDKGLKEMFEVTAISYLPDSGRPFVASAESTKYPFFGTLFHPEKATQIYYEGIDINHSWVSI